MKMRITSVIHEIHLMLTMIAVETNQIESDKYANLKLYEF